MKERQVPSAMIWGFQSLLPYVAADAAVFSFGLLLQHLASLHWTPDKSACDQLQSSQTASGFSACEK
eukprot:6390887-Karenia_brevis.AAC.1